MTMGSRNFFFKLILAIFAGTVEVKADQILNLFDNKAVEHCDILQPFNTRDVISKCRGNYVTSQRFGENVLLRIASRNQAGFTYRFHSRLDSKLSIQRFNALRKVAELCFSAGTCSELTRLTDNDSYDRNHWNCRGKHLTIELEQVWVVGEQTLLMGEFRNLHLCIDERIVRGIVQPFFKANPISSRPDFDYDKHVFSYFEFDPN